MRWFLGDGFVGDEISLIDFSNSKIIWRKPVSKSWRVVLKPWISNFLNSHFPKMKQLNYPVQPSIKVARTTWGFFPPSWPSILLGCRKNVVWNFGGKLSRKMFSCAGVSVSSVLVKVDSKKILHWKGLIFGGAYYRREIRLAGFPTCGLFPPWLHLSQHAYPEHMQLVLHTAFFLFVLCEVIFFLYVSCEYV